MRVTRTNLPENLLLFGALSLALFGCQPTEGGAGTSSEGGAGGSVAASNGGTTSNSSSAGETKPTGGTVGAGGSVATSSSKATGGSPETGDTTATGSGGKSTATTMGNGGSTVTTQATGGATTARGGATANGGASAGAGRSGMAKGGSGNGGNEAGGSNTGGAGKGGNGAASGGPGMGGKVGAGGGPVTGGTSTVTSSTATGGGTTTGCTKGQVKAKEVVIMGESFYAMSPQYIQKRIEDNAKKAGAIGSGDSYRNVAVSGQPMSYIASTEWDNASKSTTKVVIMDGGGIDCMSSECSTCPDTFKTLLGKMATAGVQEVIYTRYPEPGAPPGSNTTLKGNLDKLMPKMQPVCEGATGLKCHWVDLRPVWKDGDTTDGLHPTQSGGDHVGDAIWAEMVKDCIAQ